MLQGTKRVLLSVMDDEGEIIGVADVTDKFETASHGVTYNKEDIVIEPIAPQSGGEARRTMASFAICHELNNGDVVELYRRTFDRHRYLYIKKQSGDGKQLGDTIVIQEGSLMVGIC